MKEREKKRKAKGKDLPAYQSSSDDEKEVVQPKSKKSAKSKVVNNRLESTSGMFKDSDGTLLLSLILIVASCFRVSALLPVVHVRLTSVGLQCLHFRSNVF